MSEPDQQNQIAETLSLLGRMTPAALASNRDELFFRAGEASGRAQRRGNSRSGNWLLPAAAAVLAILATVLGTALLYREPQLQIVYVERAAEKKGDEARITVKDASPRQIRDRNGAEQFDSRYALDEIRRGLATDGMIPRHDWLALSDAFAQQMRLQQERSQTARAVAPVTAAEDGDAPRERARTYLELRDAMQAM